MAGEVGGRSLHERIERTASRQQTATELHDATRARQQSKLGTLELDIAGLVGRRRAGDPSFQIRERCTLAGVQDEAFLGFKPSAFNESAISCRVLRFFPLRRLASSLIRETTFSSPGSSPNGRGPSHLPLAFLALLRAAASF